MTQPKRANDTDNGRYYSRPGTGQQFVSVTNVLSTCVAKPALVGWATKITAEKAADMMPILVAAARVDECKPKRVADECGRCTTCVIKTIKREVTIIREKASDLGTRIHSHADAHLTGKAIPDDDEVTPYLEQYLRFIEEWDVDIENDVEAAELTVAHPDLWLAGTLDILIRLRPKPGADKRLLIVDIKTSAAKPADTVYDEMALQLTALRHCTEMWLPDDSIVPMVEGITGGAVLNLRTDSYALIPLPTGEEPWKAYQGLLEGAHYLHTEPVKSARPVSAADGEPVQKPTRKRTAKKTTTPKTTTKAA